MTWALLPCKRAYIARQKRLFRRAIWALLENQCYSSIAQKNMSQKFD